MIKKPNMRRVTIWYQEAWGNNKGGYASERIRMIFPDGSAIWISLCRSEHIIGIDWNSSCWNMKSYAKIAKSGEEALKMMREYDEDNYYPQAKFIGYV